MRYASIDVLRAVAIVLMVVVHYLENLSGVDWAPAGFGAPLFTFLVGVSYRLWVNGQERKGRSEEEISKVSVRRGLFLFALGFAFNVFVWLPEDAFNWDVLTLIGTALLVLNVVRNVPPAVPAVMAVAAFALGPVLRELTAYPQYWLNGYFECDADAGEVLLGFLAVGYFPVFPWLAYPLVGFVTGSGFFGREPGENAPTLTTALLGTVLLATSGVLWALRLTVPEAAALPGWTMFPASPEYVLSTLGTALVLFALGHRWLDRPGPGERGWLIRVAGTLSRYSLSMYLLHHVAHLWPLWLYGTAFGTEPTQFWRAALPVAASLPLAGACLVAGYLLFRWMERTERRGVEGWMRYLCD